MVDRKQIPNCVYHYCSTSALRSIVESGRFRLGNVFFMNDYTEVEWFMEICRRVIKTGCYQAAFRKNLLGLLSRPFDHIYCGCFSEAQDDLSQWRGYADDGRGVAIGVDLNVILEKNKGDGNNSLELRYVEYDESTTREEAEKVIQNHVAIDPKDPSPGSSEADFAFMSLRYLAPIFKNPAFCNEQEIRLICRDSRDIDDLCPRDKYQESRVKRLGSEIKFSDRRGKLVPYVSFELPCKAVEEVWLGPQFGDKRDESALRLFLTSHGINAKLRRSEAPYRT